MIRHRKRNEARSPNGIKAISEFTIQPDRRDEFVRLFESLVAKHFEPLRGRLPQHHHLVIDGPDQAVEISEWESAEARERTMQSEAMGAFASVRTGGRSPQYDGGRAVALTAYPHPA